MGGIALKAEKLLGPLGGDEWGQTGVWFSKNGKGVLGLFVCLRGGGKLEAATQGRELLTRTEDLYKIAGKNRQGLGKIKRFLEKEGERLARSWAVDLGMVGLAAGQVVILLRGEGKVFLQRSGQTGVVGQGKEEGWTTSEGEVKTGDRLAALTVGFWKNREKIAWQEVLSKMSLEEAKDFLASKMYAGAEGEAAAGFLIEVEEKSGRKILKDKIKEIWIGFLKRRKRDEKPVFLKEEREERIPGKKKKTLLTVGGVLLVLLAASVMLNLKERRLKTEEEAKNRLREEIAFKIEEGRLLTGISFSRAAEVLAEAEGLLVEAGKWRALEAEVLGWQEALAEAKLLAADEEEVKDLEVFYDLQILREGAEGARMELGEGKLWVWDNEKGLVMTVDLETKAGEVMVGDERLRGSGAVAGNGGFWIALEGELAEVSERGVSWVLEEEDWGGDLALEVFGKARYVGELEKGVIWRYPELGGGELGERENWFGEGEGRPFAAMAIDGSAWVVNKQGEVMKFSRGKREAWEIKGLEMGALVGVEKIETSEEAEKLYLIKKNQGEILVVSKKGDFERKYWGEALRNAADWVVDEQTKSAYVLKGTEIRKLTLR